FVAGLATWCVCIGILEGARPVAGVVHLPCLDETYAAVGGAAWLNGAPLASLGDTGPVGDRFIVTHAHAHRRHRITYRGKVRSLGSTAYHVALVARGAADGALLGHAHLWDLAGQGAVLAGVGGGYEYLGGGPVDLAVLADGRGAPDYVLAGAAAATVVEIEALGVRALALPGDLARGDEVVRLAREAESRSGGVDVLVNNAANYLRASFDELSEAIWDASLDVNLKAPFLLA